MIEKIVKRDGRVVPFNREKITFAILQAAIAVGGRDRKEAERVTDDVIKMLEARGNASSYPTVEEVQDLVEKALIERGHAKTAKAYILYRYEHALRRQGKKSLTYSSENIPYRKLWEALSWSVDHGCVTLSELENIIRRNEFVELIEESEKFYKSEIDEAVKRIRERLDEIKIVIVAGPSSSGKTTTTIKIGEALKEDGVRFVPINVDNYFFDLDNQPMDSTGDYDYETPQALDLGLIRKHLARLIDGQSIDIPRYNFRTGKREGISATLSLKKGDVILIDSLHGMFPEMTEGIPEEKKFKIYIETLSQIKDKNYRFVRWADIRMLRRMVRDMQFRNYGPEKTVAHWHLVRRSELRYIISKLRDAHVIVNSYLGYELPILKSRVGNCFSKFAEKFRDDPDRQDAYERSVRVMELLNEIPEWKDESVVPKNSLLREFIGGSVYKY